MHFLAGIPRAGDASAGSVQQGGGRVGPRGDRVRAAVRMLAIRRRQQETQPGRGIQGAGLGSYYFVSRFVFVFFQLLSSGGK